MFQKILVPVDGSQYSLNAAHVAVTMAEKFGSSVTLLHVIDISTITSFSTAEGQLPNITESMTEVWRDSGEKVIKGALNAIGDTKVDIKTELIWGKPTQIICDHIKQGFDIVVMGSQGRGGFREFFIGSVSSRISHIATCPVLIVKNL